MKRLTYGFGALVALAAPLAALADPITSRQALMSGNGAAAAVAGGMLKNEIPFDPVVARLVLRTMNATAIVYGDFFPEGSGDPARSKADPAIWSDRAGFDAEVAKFQASTAKAVEAAGRDGPADLAAFQAAVGPAFDSCKTCHETYQVPTN